VTDQELVAYFDAQFRAMSEKVDAQFRAVDAQFRAVDAQFSSMSEQIESLRTEFADESRQTRVVVEDLRSDVQLVAEGLMGFGERMEAHQAANLLRFDDVKASISPYYRNLDQRTAILEGKADRWDRNVIEVLRERLARGWPNAPRAVDSSR
jgi:multidrug resistance efflux pump